MQTICECGHKIEYERSDILNAHYVCCGDSTKSEDVAKLMGGFRADLVITDPPYNVNYSGQGKKTSNKIENDNMSRESFRAFLLATFNCYKEAAKVSAPFYVCHSSSSQRDFEDAMESAGLHIRNQIIWNKTIASMGWGDYRWKHEPIFYATFENSKHQFYGDRSQYTVLDEKWDIDKIIKNIKKYCEKMDKGGSTIWKMSRDSHYEHPCLPAGELVLIDGEWKPIEDVLVGEKTSYGEVVEISNHNADSIVEIELDDGPKVRSTENHPFLIERDGDVFWLEAGMIQTTDMLLTNTNALSTMKPCQEEKTDCQPSELLHLKDIDVSTMPPKNDVVLSTSSFGNSKMEQSRKDLASTISMETSSIIVLRTWKLSVPLNTSGFTLVVSKMDLEDGSNLVGRAENSSQLTQNFGTSTPTVGSRQVNAKNVSSSEASQFVKLLRRKVGSVRTIQRKEKVYNLTISGVPAFDTVIGVSHNTQKPIELIEVAIYNSSKSEDLILDLFGGSGSTLIAAEKTGRQCFMMELDPRYCQVIIDRWEKYAERKAEKMQ